MSSGHFTARPSISLKSFVRINPATQDSAAEKAPVVYDRRLTDPPPPPSKRVPVQHTPHGGGRPATSHEGKGPSAPGQPTGAGQAQAARRVAAPQRQAWGPGGSGVRGEDDPDGTVLRNTHFSGTENPTSSEIRCKGLPGSAFFSCSIPRPGCQKFRLYIIFTQSKCNRKAAKGRGFRRTRASAD